MRRILWLLIGASILTIALGPAASASPATDLATPPLECLDMAPESWTQDLAAACLKAIPGASDALGASTDCWLPWFRLIWDIFGWL